mgnify:CR=1 FL=1
MDKQLSPYGEKKAKEEANTKVAVAVIRVLSIVSALGCAIGAAWAFSNLHPSVGNAWGISMIIFLFIAAMVRPKLT